jgi:hypothetical protein
VLQVPTVFSNATRGIVAKKEEVAKAFGANMSQLEICKLILQKGEVQVGDKEREAELVRCFYIYIYSCFFEVLWFGRAQKLGSLDY